MKNILYFILAIYLITGCQTSSDKNLEVIPPFEKIHIEENEVSIDPSVQQMASFANGVRVEIPKDAFMDIEGKVITEKVVLSIKTFNTEAAIIASGIPMTYSHDGVESNFESAGMFQILGQSQGEPVFIQEGKELTINYSSKVYGDYDFFHFEEDSEKDLTTRGKWQKLTNIKKDVIDSNKVLDTFELQFATEEYPELKPLSAIKWKLASRFSNPNDHNNKWVLNQKWSSIEVSKPRYAFGDTLIDEKVNYTEYLESGAIMTTNDGNRIITSGKPFTRIWDRSGNLLKTIDKVTEIYNPVEIINDQYFIVERKGGDYLFDRDGNEICNFDNSFNRNVIPSKERIVYNVYGKPYHIKIKDFKGSTIKEIQLSNDTRGYGLNGVYAHFLVTPDDELITNSLDGIVFYDLEGNKLKQREGNYKFIEYLSNGSLLITTLNGTLLMWDYKNNIEKESQQSDFDLRSKINGNTWYNSYSNEIIGTDYIRIQATNEEHSKLWNYKLNKTTNLPFYHYHHPYDSLPQNLISGYSGHDSTYHLYDIVKQEDIITIPGLNSCFDCESDFYNTSISNDNNFIVINSDSHNVLYSLKGNLIRDFKQFDSLIFTAGFISDNTIFTLSEDGIYRIWSTGGIEISSKKLKNEEFIYGWHFNNQIITYDRVFNDQKYYNLDGDLLLAPGKTPVYNFLDSTSIIHLSRKKSAILNNLSSLVEPTAYQLLLRSGDKEFITYVHLDDNDFQTINKYYTDRAKKIDQEKERQKEELGVIRRFKLKNFGIYNWDKLIGDTDRIFFAAHFEFDIPVDYNNITVFQVEDMNGAVVIKYNKREWESFSYNPNVPTKLIAILPDNKIGLFESEDFKAINVDNISKEKVYTFKMKVTDEPITNLPELEDKVKM